MEVKSWALRKHPRSHEKSAMQGNVSLKHIFMVRWTQRKEEKMERKKKKTTRRCENENEIPTQ